MESISKSRFNNSARNVGFSMIAQVLTIILNIAGRRVFLTVLDAKYLGVSTAFSSILNVLSLAELGVGSAIIYSLYKPIAENNETKICALMGLYRKVYWIVGLFILIVGAALTPFLDFFVQEMPDIPHIRLVYILLVIQTASAYFFSYKTNFLSATQQGYITQKYQMIISVAQLILQIGVLLITQNYFSYLILGIALPLLRNILVSKRVDLMYPFIRKKPGRLDKSETDTIKKNVFALFLYKISNTLSTTIDTILISKMLGVIEVAVYSNYHFIINYSDLLFINVLGAVTPSIGNLMTTDDVEKKKNFLSTLQMLYMWIATYLAVGLIVLFNPLIKIWLGEEYLFPEAIVIALVISITLTNFQRPCSLMRDANGLFWYGKLRPLAMAIINVVASIILTKMYGTIGVVIGTCISKIATFVWYDPYVVFKHTLKSGMKQYFVKYIYNWAVLAVLAGLCYFLFAMIPFEGIGAFMLGVVMITIIVNGALFFLNFKTKEFSYLMEMSSGIRNKLKGKFSHIR